MEKQLSLDHLTDFEEIFRKYYPSLLAFVERHVGDREVARDFVQDVFFRLYESGGVFLSDVSLKSWLFTTSRNLALDYLRHLKVVDDHRILLAESMMYAVEVDEEVNEELARKINEAIDTLPLQCRLIIRMNIMEGRKYTEISAALGISVNTVKTQIFRGYKKLRELLSAPLNPLVLFCFHLYLWMMKNNKRPNYPN